MAKNLVKSKECFYCDHSRISLLTWLYALLMVVLMYADVLDCIVLFLVITVEYFIVELLNWSLFYLVKPAWIYLNIFWMCNLEYVVTKPVVIGCWRLCLYSIFYPEATLSWPWHIVDPRCQQSVGWCRNWTCKQGQKPCTSSTRTSATRDVCPRAEMADSHHHERTKNWA